MKIDMRVWMAPILAIVLLGITLQQTMGALKTAGAWRKQQATRPTTQNPYAHLDALVSAPQPEIPETMRNPLNYGNRPAPVRRPTRRTSTPRPPVERPKPKPVLTSIIWDNDPRATLRYNERDFSIREDGLFADFRVVRITQTMVILERNGERTVLTIRPKGDSN